MTLGVYLVSRQVVIFPALITEESGGISQGFTLISRLLNHVCLTNKAKDIKEASRAFRRLMLMFQVVSIHKLFYW